MRENGNPVVSEQRKSPPLEGPAAVLRGWQGRALVKPILCPVRQIPSVANRVHSGSRRSVIASTANIEPDLWEMSIAFVNREHRFRPTRTPASQGRGRVRRQVRRPQLDGGHVSPTIPLPAQRLPFRPVHARSRRQLSVRITTIEHDHRDAERADASVTSRSASTTTRYLSWTPPSSPREKGIPPRPCSASPPGCGDWRAKSGKTGQGDSRPGASGVSLRTQEFQEGAVSFRRERSTTSKEDPLPEETGCGKGVFPFDAHLGTVGQLNRELTGDRSRSSSSFRCSRPVIRKGIPGACGGWSQWEPTTSSGPDRRREDGGVPRSHRFRHVLQRSSQKGASGGRSLPSSPCVSCRSSSSRGSSRPITARRSRTKDNEKIQGDSIRRRPFDRSQGSPNESQRRSEAVGSFGQCSSTECGVPGARKYRRITRAASSLLDRGISFLISTPQR